MRKTRMWSHTVRAISRSTKTRCYKTTVFCSTNWGETWAVPQLQIQKVSAAWLRPDSCRSSEARLKNLYAMTNVLLLHDNSIVSLKRKWKKIATLCPLYHVWMPHCKTNVGGALPSVRNPRASKENLGEHFCGYTRWRLCKTWTSYN